MKLGILRLSHLGDIVHSLPLAFLINREMPDFDLHFIIEKKYISVLSQLNFIKKFIPFEPKINFFSILRKVNLDVILDLQGLYKTSLISFFSNSCKRIGMDFKSLKEPFLYFLYHKRIKPSGIHIIEKNLSFGKYFGIKNFDLSNYHLKELSQDREGKVLKFLNELNFENFIIFHPFSSKKEKYFPLEPIKKLNEIFKKKFSMVLSYGPGEEKEAENVSNYLKIFKIPPLGINEKSYLIEKAKFFIGPDTGLLHISDALRIPTIGYFTIYPPERNGAYFSKNLSFYKEEVDFKKILKFLEENCSFS